MNDARSAVGAPSARGAARRAWPTRVAWTIAGVALIAVALANAPPLLGRSRVSNEIIIARTPQEVFEYVTTPAIWPAWHPSSVAVRGAVDHPLLVGESAVETFVVAGRRGEAQWTVVERTPPRRFAIAGRPTGSDGGARITYTLEARPEGTRFHRDMEYRMPSLWGDILDILLLHDRVAAESDEAVRRLRERAEARP